MTHGFPVKWRKMPDVPYLCYSSWRICCCRPLYSSRFATRTVRTQGIGRRGKKRAYLAQPKADWGQARPSLALSWPTGAHLAQLGRNLRRARASWLQLGPNLSPTGLSMRKLVLCGASGSLNYHASAPLVGADLDGWWCLIAILQVWHHQPVMICWTDVQDGTYEYSKREAFDVRPYFQEVLCSYQQVLWSWHQPRPSNSSLQC